MNNEPANPQLFLTLLLGGVRAGKSARALQIARLRANDAAAPVLFVATAQAFDAEMAQRITAHQAERPSHWHTLEEPVAIAENIALRLVRQPSIHVVVIDCLTLWVSNMMLSCANDADVEVLAAERTRELLNVMQRHARTDAGGLRHWVVVSNEVGLGIVPPTLLGRQYRDALGRTNQLMAAAANEVTLMVAGLAIPLKVPAPRA